jgi:hypothetical protein
MSASCILTTPLRVRLFHTGSLTMPVSRFLCEHLLDEVTIIEACTSRIHAQVPVATTGNLSHPLVQNAACSIDVPVVVRPARAARP